MASNADTSDLIKAALECARSVFGDVGLVAWTPLTGSPPSTVARMTMLTDEGGRTVIVKSTSSNARESAALQLLTEAKVLAVHDNPPLILIEDLEVG